MILVRSLRELRLQSKLLPPNWRDRQLSRREARTCRNTWSCDGLVAGGSVGTSWELKTLRGSRFWRVLVPQLVKNLPATQEIQVQSLVGEDPLEKEMATHSSVLAWKIPWTQKPGRLQSMGSQRVRHDLATNPHFCECSPRNSTSSHYKDQIEIPSCFSQKEGKNIVFSLIRPAL